MLPHCADLGSYRSRQPSTRRRCCSRSSTTLQRTCVSCRVVSCRVVSCRVVSCWVALCCVVSCRVVSPASRLLLTVTMRRARSRHSCLLTPAPNQKCSPPSSASRKSMLPTSPAECRSTKPRTGTWCRAASTRTTRHRPKASGAPASTVWRCGTSACAATRHIALLRKLSTHAAALDDTVLHGLASTIVHA